jgi:L-seryl-tRNA(Ser) seleniumtransferase
MTAVELFVKRDHQAIWKDWERQVSAIGKAVSGIKGVETEQFLPVIANQVPHLAIKWDPKAIAKTRDDIAKALRDGEPRIEVRPSAGNEPRLDIAVWMLAPGEYEVVGKRCAEVLKAAAQKA